MVGFRCILFSLLAFLFNVRAYMCSDINPDLKPLLDKLNLDEKYHGLANEMFNQADKTLVEEKNPLKHIEGLNSRVRMLLASIPGPENLIGTEIEIMGKKILHFAKQEFEQHIIAESTLKSKYNMSDEDIAKFKTLYNDTKKCVEKLNVLFHCV